MKRSKKSKTDFSRDEKGRAILGSAHEMAEWVRLGFAEQDERRSLVIPFYQHFIDLSNCVLYTSSSKAGNGTESHIFNLCDMAGVVPGIEKIEDAPNYLFEVKYNIHLNGSVLYGNFFHYVKFDGKVNMDEVTIRSTFSCFKCLFLDYVYMQHIHITGRSDFEQCEFKQGLVLSDGKADLFHFNNCTVNERLSLSSACLVNRNHKEYHQSIEFTNSTIEELELSKVTTDGLPIYIGDSIVNGMHIDNISLNSTLYFISCVLKGVMTTIKDEGGTSNKIKEIEFHSCEVVGQYHIENSQIEKFTFNFSKIGESGRLRLSQCEAGELIAGCSSVIGQMDVTENEISTLCMEGSCVQGNLNFQDNQVGSYTDRQTLRLLKNEALKVNDDVAARELYAKEMEMLLSDKGVSAGDKASLWLNKCFSKFGESWARALWITLLLSVILTLLMLGIGSETYMFNPSEEFMGIESFLTTLLDSINVFSIPLFSDTIKEYGLNVWGQILYFAIKLVVAYGSYQFVVAFRKYGKG